MKYLFLLTVFSVSLAVAMDNSQIIDSNNTVRASTTEVLPTSSDDLLASLVEKSISKGELLSTHMIEEKYDISEIDSILEIETLTLRDVILSCDQNTNEILKQLVINYKRSKDLKTLDKLDRIIKKLDELDPK